ncbi:MAG: hypothetical protein V1735_01345 [Nanoarchaeota archaeon]
MVLIVALLSLFSLSFVRAETTKVGAQIITYDDMIDYGDMHSYYASDKLVLSTFDDNKDGEPDQWFVYGDDFVVTSAMGDQDGNGRPDYLVGYDEHGNVVSERVSGSFIKDFGKTLWRLKWFILGALVAIFAILGSIKFRKKRRKGKQEEKHEKHIKETNKHGGKHKRKQPRKKLLLLILAILIIFAMVFAQQYISSHMKPKPFTFNLNIQPLPPSRNTTYDPFNAPNPSRTLP